MPDFYHKIDISRSNTPLHIKFALLCLNKTKTPKWAAYFCFIISHLQVSSIIIKSAYLALPDDTPSVSQLFELSSSFLLWEIGLTLTIQLLFW